MVIMALDHVRDHFMSFALDPTDLKTTTIALFLTRFATHFCAPIFFFTAGISAFLSLGRGKDLGHMRRMLVSRGLWLIVLELAVVNFLFLNFPPNPRIGQTLWALGWSMIALSVLSRLPRNWLAGLGLLMVFGHNALDGITVPGWFNTAWKVLHTGDVVHLGSVAFVPFYPLIPWIGVMALGYAIGPIFTAEPAERKRWLAILGTACLAGFVVFRGGNFYGDPHPWTAQNDPAFTLLSLINVNKYPPSLSYLLITLGVGFWLMLGFEKLREAGKDRLVRTLFLDFGRVPMFYYLAHLILIDLFLIFWVISMGGAKAMEQAQGPNPPAELFASLPMVYALWSLVLLILYPLCRAYAKRKAENPRPWMSYL